ncbi:DUF6622 family protein [Vibrio spartinae]|nr:DUF6622 family protein [Vibrio spartinae]
MTVLSILEGTPMWVWILFVFLLLRGVIALHDREMEIKRLFLLPVVFLFWGGAGVVNELHFPNIGLVCSAIGLLSGGAVGWMLWRRTPRLKFITGTALVIRPGTTLTLIFILIAFLTKFVLTACLSIFPEYSLSLNFNLIYGFLCGVIDGVFWGGTLNLYFSRREYIERTVTS